MSLHKIEWIVVVYGVATQGLYFYMLLAVLNMFICSFCRIKQCNIIHILNEWWWWYSSFILMMMMWWWWWFRWLYIHLFTFSNFKLCAMICSLYFFSCVLVDFSNDLQELFVSRVLIVMLFYLRFILNYECL